VTTITSRMLDGGHGANAPLPTLRFAALLGAQERRGEIIAHV
jgi:hypothetical protein